MASKFNTTAYRYENEELILWGTIILVLAIIVFTAAATLCLSVLFILGILVFSYYSGKSSHSSLLQGAQRITRQQMPQAAQLVEECVQRLQIEAVDVFVIPQRELNAYTFGLSSPKAIVLYEPLFRVMDSQELQFIIGHEMGHIKLGHTWLNSLVGGMAGIPASYSAAFILILALRWWNRSCEFSADRAGMLACSNMNKAITALIKLEVGTGRISAEQMENALQRIDAEDDDMLNNLGELLATHPMIIKRINQLREYARSQEYKRLQDRMNQNLLS